MSISIMTEVWRIENLSSSQKLVFLSLADNANDQGECYPSMRQISARTCLSERAVRDAVRALESVGLRTIGIALGHQHDVPLIHNPGKCRRLSEALPIGGAFCIPALISL